MASHSNLALVEGEQIFFTLPVKVLNKNPLQKLFAMLFGSFMRAQLIVTNKRIVVEGQKIQLWCLEKGMSFSSYLPQSITKVGFFYEPAMCCKSFVLDMTFSSGESFMYIIKGAKESAVDACNMMIKTFVH